jgi:NAD kinase
MQTNQFRFVLVSRKTRLQELIERFNTWPQAKFYLEHNQVDAQDYLDEHDLYQKRLLEAEMVLKKTGRFQLIERGFLPSYQFSPTDIVIVIGQDGLVANTLKYINGRPLIAINPDPSRWDGKLLRFETAQLKEIIDLTIADKASSETVTFAEVLTNDGQSMLAVNDLFIGPKSHTSAHYTLRWNGQIEAQSSSGIIVTTGLGSTGWFQSILAGANGVTGKNSHAMSKGFAWKEQRLQFVVREPFPSKTTGTSLVFGALTKKNTLTLESSMPENGIIFSDGIETDFLEFNSGCIVSIGVSETYGRLISE